MRFGDNFITLTLSSIYFWTSWSKKLFKDSKATLVFLTSLVTFIGK